MSQRIGKFNTPPHKMFPHILELGSNNKAWIESYSCQKPPTAAARPHRSLRPSRQRKADIGCTILGRLRLAKPPWSCWKGTWHVKTDTRARITANWNPSLSLEPRIHTALYPDTQRRNSLLHKYLQCSTVIINRGQERQGGWGRWGSWGVTLPSCVSVNCCIFTQWVELGSTGRRDAMVGY